MVALDVAPVNEFPDVCEVLQLMGSPFDKSDDEVNYCLDVTNQRNYSCHSQGMNPAC